MNNKTPISEQLKTKYHECEEVTNLKEMIYRSAKLYGNKVAFKLKNDTGIIYSKTYSQVLEDIKTVGEYLIENGLQDKRIAVIGKNSYKWAISYLAATIVGVVVPIDKELHYEDIINFMNVSETQCILGDNKNLKQIIDNKDKLNNKKTIFISFDNKNDTKNYVSFDNIFKQNNYLEKNRFEKIEVNPDEMRVLLFTSGTTGNAKGVCLSHRNICSNILSIYGIVKVRKSDLFFSILPLHHTYECTIGFLLPLYSGASICYCDGLRYISNNILEYKPSVILCVPLLLEKMYKKIIKNIQESLPKIFTENKKEEDIFNTLPGILKAVIRAKVKKTLGGRLRVFIVGAAPVNPEIGDLFDKLHLNSLQGYGLTECAPLVSGNTDFFKRNDSPGLPIPNVEYKIDNPNDEGVGEIIVKGPNVMLGYYNMPEETAEVIKDGWFHTGDLGKIDDDGYLFITGRCKSVIITKNGKNIYPEEIEGYLNESPFVAEALVLGKQNNKNEDSTVIAYIYPNKDELKEEYTDRELSNETINQAISKVVSEVNSKMPNYKHIKKFFIRDTEFEKTTTQKIKRYGNNVEKV